MQQIIRGKFSWCVARKYNGRVHTPLLTLLKIKHGNLKFSHWSQRPPRLLVSRTLQENPRRGYGMIIARILRGALKIRYVVLGGAVGGGLTLQDKYKEWKDGLPDVSWIKSILPDNSQIDKFKGSMLSLKDKFSDFEIDPRLRAAGENQFLSMKDWFDKRLDEAYMAAEERERARERTKLENRLVTLSVNAQSDKSRDEQRREAAEQKADVLQKQLQETQKAYQKEVTRLEKEVKDLRQQLLLRGAPSSTHKVQHSLIDMYSDVLDELSGYDTSYQTQDHLPRVVVVGDQSAGKTSVLEMIAQARIFPRGAGEMMTRAPVKVTLSEGPYHIAQFRDSDREYDLTKEKDLEDLRNQVELRMTGSVLGP